MIVSKIGKLLSRGAHSPSPSADILYPSEDSRSAGDEQSSSLSVSIAESDFSENSREMRSRSAPLHNSTRNDGVASRGAKSVKQAWSENNDYDRESFFSFATSLYAVFMIVFLLIEETSLEEPPQNAHQIKISGIFSFYMYTVGIGFFIYVYFFIIYPSWINRILNWLSNRGTWRKAKNFTIVPASHDSESVNSKFLRVGIVFFALTGIAAFGFGYFDQISSPQLYMKLYAAPITVFYRFHCSVCLAEIREKSFVKPKETVTRVNSITAQPQFTIVTID